MTSTLDEYVKTLAPAQYDKSTVADRHREMERVLGESSMDAGYWFERLLVARHSATRATATSTSWPGPRGRALCVPVLR